MLSRPIILFVACLIVIADLGAKAQTAGPITPEMRAAANDAYQKQDWNAAATAYETIVKAEDKNAGARYRYGMVLLALNQNAKAVENLDFAMSISPNPVFALAAARGYARLGNKARMYEVLEKSLTLGGIAPESLTGENDFSGVRSEAKFADLVKRSDMTVNPCKARPEFRQFDFWIGEWDVRNPQGLPVGTSTVQLILGECIIFENWTSGSGSSGKSFNIYDVNDKKWHQTWVSDKGAFTHYIGGLEDGKMVVVADTIVAGKKTLARMTFSKLPNGDVRQFGENSTDEGKTWTTAFDLIYSRKKEGKKS